jgi:hypothetical protein
MFHLPKKPTQEDDGGGNLDGVELDLVEKPVRIEAAALHTISFPAERDSVNPRSTTAPNATASLWPSRVGPSLFGSKMPGLVCSRNWSWLHTHYATKIGRARFQIPFSERGNGTGKFVSVEEAGDGKP